VFTQPAPQAVLSGIGYGDSSSRAFPNRDAGAWTDGMGWPQRVCVRTTRYRLDLSTRRSGAVVDPGDADVFFADTVTDPAERTNLADDPRYATVVRDLTALALAGAAAIPEAVVRTDDFTRTRSATSPV
jgi:hypothetical protein